MCERHCGTRLTLLYLILSTFCRCYLDICGRKVYVYKEHESGELSLPPTLLQQQLDGAKRWLGVAIVFLRQTVYGTLTAI